MPVFPVLGRSSPFNPLEVNGFFTIYFRCRYKAADLLLEYGMDIGLLQMQKRDANHLMGLAVLGIRC